MAQHNRIVVVTDRDIFGGTPVFAGTLGASAIAVRLSRRGDTLDEFLAQFPPVTCEQAISALGLARDTLLADAFR